MAAQNLPLITVGIPTYNRASYLREMLSRVTSQDYRRLEIIVGDDGSTDETSEVVAGITDHRVKYLRLPENRGIPHVLNTILSESTGEAIVMLHDHDVHLPSLVSSMAEVLWSSDVGFVNPGVAWIDNNGGNHEVMPPLAARLNDGRALAKHLLLGPSLACPITACALVRRSAYEAVGFSYDPAFGFLCDVDMWLRLLMLFDAGQADEVRLLCRRRDSTHGLARAGWELLALNRAIHRTNLARLLAEPAEKLRAERSLDRKVRRSALRELGSALSTGDREHFMGGLRFMSAGTEVGDTRAPGPFRSALRDPRLHKPLGAIPSIAAPIMRLRSFGRDRFGA